MWLLLAIGAAIALRIWLPRLQASRDPLSKTLVFHFGIRPSGPEGRWTGRDRFLSGALSLVTAGACFGIALFAVRALDTLPVVSTASHVASGAMFLFALFGLLATIYAVADFVRAPFTKPWKSEDSVHRGQAG